MYTHLFVILFCFKDIFGLEKIYYIIFAITKKKKKIESRFLWGVFSADLKFCINFPGKTTKKNPLTYGTFPVLTMS